MSESDSLRVNPDEKPDDFQAMAVGASVVFVLAVIPFVNLLGCCLIPQILGGLTAVYWYTHKNHLTISSGKGIVLGILTCLFGGIAAFVVVMLLQKLGFDPTQAMIQEWSIQLAEKLGGPEAAEQARKQIEAQNARGMGAVQVVIGLVMSIVLNAVGGLIGGAIGAAVFKKAPPEAPVV